VTRPVPTSRALALAGLGLLPAALAVLAPPVALFAAALDAALLVLVLFDFLRAPRPEHVLVRRSVAPVLSAGVVNVVRLALEQAPGARGPVRGELRDTVAPGPVIDGNRQPLRFEGRAQLQWRLTPLTRGDLAFGDLWLRLEGPLGLCARQFRVPAAQTVKVFPDLTALTKDALTLARATEDDARRVVRVRSEGREFESLREYRVGDDRRSIDWKASARRGKAIVRVHQPERNQVVLLLLDCGRHMAGEVGGRRKLDHAVDAALRVAKVSLDQGDQVGVMAFATGVKAWLPPRRGAEQVRAIAQALYRVEATLEESDYGAAIDLAFARGARRSLVMVMTDLLDADTASSLVRRTLRLVPRHLPVVASMLDEDVQRAAQALPRSRPEAYERVVASKLEAETRQTVAKLRDAGAHVVRASARELGAATVNSYLDIKARGLL